MRRNITSREAATDVFGRLPRLTPQQRSFAPPGLPQIDFQSLPLKTRLLARGARVDDREYASDVEEPADLGGVEEYLAVLDDDGQ